LITECQVIATFFYWSINKVEKSQNNKEIFKKMRDNIIIKLWNLMGKKYTKV